MKLYQDVTVNNPLVLLTADTLPFFVSGFQATNGQSKFTSRSLKFFLQMSKLIKKASTSYLLLEQCLPHLNLS
jgi:hypothetical protein